MAIYGQMTGRSRTAEEGGEEGEGEVTPDKLHEVTAEATKDLEHVLSHLSESINDLTLQRPPAPSATPQTSDPPHFTIADSPTDRRGPENKPPTTI